MQIAELTKRVLELENQLRQKDLVTRQQFMEMINQLEVRNTQFGPILTLKSAPVSRM